MSWQAYVDNQLIATGKVSHAAILGQQGGVWAISAGFTFAPGEEAAVINAFENLAHTQANGIALAGRKYSVISGEPIRLLGMSQSFGCILLKTTQTIIVGQCDPPIQLAEMQLFVERLGDYLKGIGY